MSKEKSTAFEVFVQNDELLKAVQPALEAAKAAAARAGGDFRGSVFCQIYAPGSLDRTDGVRIKGAFIEREWAEKLDKVLKARKAMSDV